MKVNIEKLNTTLYTVIAVEKNLSYVAEDLQIICTTSDEKEALERFNNTVNIAYNDLIEGLANSADGLDILWGEGDDEYEAVRKALMPPATIEKLETIDIRCPLHGDNQYDVTKNFFNIKKWERNGERVFAINYAEHDYAWNTSSVYLKKIKI